MLQRCFRSLALIAVIPFVAVLSWASMTVPAGAVVILNIDLSGQLLGAENVDVGGTLYNVEFVDGSCVALFDGCDDPTDFAFSTQADALAAGQALLDMVFLDTVLGNFDTDPTLTNGCDFSQSCATLIPYDPTPFVGSVLNANSLTDSMPFPLVVASPTADLAANIEFVYARFTPAATAPATSLPEPGTLALFGIGLAGLGALRRRVRAAA